MHVELRGVSKSFGTGARERTAVDCVSWQAAAGEVVGLLGPNGAGKIKGNGAPETAGEATAAPGCAIAHLDEAAVENGCRSMGGKDATDRMPGPRGR